MEFGTLFFFFIIYAVIRGLSEKNRPPQRRRSQPESNGRQPDIPDIEGHFRERVREVNHKSNTATGPSENILATEATPAPLVSPKELCVEGQETILTSRKGEMQDKGRKNEGEGFFLCRKNLLHGVIFAEILSPPKSKR